MTTLKFYELNLSKEIQKAITDMGFEECTPIQSQSIPVILKGKDMIGQAQTGTGKTAAFGIPLIENIDNHSRKLQVVVLCPTRELAIQVSEELAQLLKYKKNIHVLPVYGGQSLDRQIKTLKQGVQIIIATPGRLIDHIERKTIDLSSVSTVVLDEGDKMLDMGFREDIEFILQKMPVKRQTVLFSATMPGPIVELSKRYLIKPEYIKVVHKELTVPGVDQFYLEIKPDMKIETLSRLLDFHNPNLALVFCNTKRGAEKLVKRLSARGYLADRMHGDMNQNQRDKVMNKFRSGKVDILVATDVVARGIDVEEIDAVFNYDMPQDEEYYVHRIGRTARAGRTGHSFTFASGNELYKIKDIERYTKTKINRYQVPSANGTETDDIDSLVRMIKKSISSKADMKKYEVILEKLLIEDFTTLEISCVLIKMLLDQSSNKKIRKHTDTYSVGDKYLSGSERKNLSKDNIIKNRKRNSGNPKDYYGKSGVFSKSVRKRFASF